MPTLDVMNEQIFRAIDALENATTREVVRNYKLALDKVRVEISRIYETAKGAGWEMSHAQMTKFHRFKSLHDRIAKQIGPVFSKNGRLTEQMAEVIYEESFFRHGWSIDQEIGVHIKWGRPRHQDVVAAVQNPISGLTLDETLAKNRKAILLKIRQEVTQGIVMGESYPTMARRIKDALGKDATKAIRVVRTEAHRVQVQGQIAAYDTAHDQGMKEERVYVATLDMKTRPQSGSMDGQIADEEGYFAYPDGSKHRVPGSTGVAAYDINDRCRVVVEIKELPPAVRRQRDKGVQPYVDYETWAEQYKPQEKAA